MQIYFLLYGIGFAAEAYCFVYTLVFVFHLINKLLLFHLVCLFLPCIDFLNYWHAVKAGRHRLHRVQVATEVATPYLINQDKTLFPTYRDELQ